MSSIHKANYKFGPPDKPFQDDVLEDHSLKHEYGCGCPSCLNIQCSNDFVASFDTKGNILIPSGLLYRTEPYYTSSIEPSGYFIGWENTGPPSGLHPVPCEYKVSISGVQNHTVNESWCQECESINNTYYAVFTESQTPEIVGQPKQIIHIPLCNDEYPIAYCNLTDIKIFLTVGTDDYANVITSTKFGTFYPYYKTFCNDDSVNYVPEGETKSPDFPYRNINKLQENRPQLYVYALVNFRYTPQTDCNCLFTGYWFLKQLGEFNGDYKTNVCMFEDGYLRYQIIPFSRTLIDECDDKAYHGDFDGRNLSFTITANDLIHINQSPEVDLCDFGEITLTVEPVDESEKYNHGFIGIPLDIIKNNGVVEGQIIYSENTPFVCFRGIKGYDWYSELDCENDEREDNGLLPQYLKISFGGVTSSNPLPPETATIETCNDCELLNTEHILELSFSISTSSKINNSDYNISRNSIKLGKTVDGNSITDFYTQYYYYEKTLDEPICCNCGDLQDEDGNSQITDDICVNKIILDIEYQDPYYVIRAFLISSQYDSRIVETPGDDVYLILAAYELQLRHDQNDGLLSLSDLSGENLSVIFTNSKYENKCNFSGSSISLNPSEPNEFGCLEYWKCLYCARDTVPDEIDVTIPDGWSYDGDECFEMFTGGYTLLPTQDAECLFSIPEVPNHTYCTYGYRETGYITYYDTWTLNMCLGFMQITGDGTLNGWDCAKNHYVVKTYNNVILVYFIMKFYIPSGVGNDWCEFEMHFGKAYPFDEWGTKIQCKRYRAVTSIGQGSNIYTVCDDAPIINPTTTLESRYIDCEFVDERLDYLFTHCTNGCYDSTLSLPHCTDWDGSPVYITSDYL